MIDPNVLFPSDAPTSTPDWFRVRQAEAQARLSGQHDRSDVQANTLFPTDAAATPPALRRTAAPSAPPADDVAAKLFSTEGKQERITPDGFQDAKTYDAKSLTSFVDGFAGSALAEGDTERAQALRDAGDALKRDFSKAGTDPADLTEALDIVKDRQSDTAFGPVNEERLVADFNESMTALAEEGVSLADIDAARAFVRDLELIAPGTIATLEATGAGNDARLIRKAVAEAKRRGY